MDYVPSNESIDDIYDFFNGLSSHPRINEFLSIKKRNSPIPSFEDMALLSFSKDFSYPIITNDYDLYFFKTELFVNKLAYKIFGLKELDIYNN